MEGVLNKNKINYILYHLSLIVDLEHLKKYKMLNFVNGSTSKQASDPGIYFKLSDSNLDSSKIKSIDDIPVLFPLSDIKDVYYFDNGNLYFRDDLLKSAFYFLSGFQEYNSVEKDELGRFPYMTSIQNKLNITHIPVVNYYFDWIKKGIEEFCSIHEIKLKPKTRLEPFTFFLTHDIDRIKFYSFNNLLQRLKDILGLTQNRQSTKKSIKQFFSILFHLLRICNKQDPWWNFNYLLKLEEKYNVKSTFFFLHKDMKHKDSYYSFNDHKIRTLIHELLTKKFDVGIHGTIRSASDLDNMIWQKDEMEKIITDKVYGIRQHNLVYMNPETSFIQQDAGFKYDSSLGFAEHEGFRNSYCMPFKLYNFQEDKAFDCWEIPLNVMDVTLFHYRKLDLTKAKNNILGLISEIMKFNGIFTLLWHNNHFNEDLIPGITDFYETLINDIMNMGPVSSTGKEIISKINNS